MSGDEIFALLLFGGLAAWLWITWYVGAVSVVRLGAPAPGKAMVFWWPVICAIALFIVLKTVSADDVRDDTLYLTFYMVLGAGWLGGATKLSMLAGLSARDDILERGNAAAVPALAGALLGFTFCFAGGNVGNGPGWSVVVFAAGLATVTLATLWLAFDRLTTVSDAVTIERDRAAGLRLGGLLAAAGLILGRGVAGDWVSSAATVADFVRTAWPAVVLFVGAALVERTARVTPDRPTTSAALLGLLPATAYLTAAVAYVIYLGPA